MIFEIPNDLLKYQKIFKIIEYAQETNNVNMHFHQTNEDTIKNI